MKNLIQTISKPAKKFIINQTNKYNIIFMLTMLTSITAIGMPPKGSGLPIYDLSSDLTCNPDHSSCSSKSWLSSIIDKQASSAKISYLYLDYSYINYFVTVDPTNAENPMKYMVNNTCSDISPIFLSYNIYPLGSKTCSATGPAANQAYNPKNTYKVMPNFSFDSSLVEAANACYSKSGATYTFNSASCFIPCTTKGNNPLFSNATKSCINDQMHITSENDLLKLVLQTGQLVGIVTAEDKTSAGASFDIEGPPFISILANQFYTGVVNQINKKYIAIWRGVNIFGRDAQDYSTLKMIAQNNGFIILSMYDIGPDDSSTEIPSGKNTLFYNHGGGLETAQPSYWYSGTPIPSTVNSFLQPGSGGFSNYSDFEIMLFGVPAFYQNSTFLDCHPKELMMKKYMTPPYTWLTGFNGCTGSKSFIQRFMNDEKIDIPFQVGIPAISSTTEWSNAMAWGDPDQLKKLEVLTSADGKEWISSGPCPDNMNISGQSCLMLSFKPDFKSPDSSQISYLSSTTGGALNILANHIQGIQSKGMNPSYSGQTLPALGQIQSYMQKNFMGLYIYALEPINFDKENCTYQLNTKGKKICFGNFPSNDFNNQIPSNVWGSIANFAKNNPLK